MTRTFVALLALSSFSCGSRFIFEPNAITATREADGKVLVTARLGISVLGASPTDLDKITEMCMTANWSETADADGGNPDAGASDGRVVLLPGTPVGVTISTVTQCQPGRGGTFQLRSSETIPQGALVTLTPFESDTSRAMRAKQSTVVYEISSAQFLSP